jgi:flagellar biosynthesis/type III secretory pathway protein FliH
MTRQPFVFEQLEAAGTLVSAGETPHSRAAEIVAAAEAAACEIEAEARARGFAEGRAAGLAAADESLEPVRSALGAALEGLAAVRSEFVAAAELRSIELAIALAEKVLGAAIGIDAALVCEVVAGALRRITDHDGIVIEVHPDDVEVVAAWIDAAKSPRVTIDVRPERRVGRGGCIVRTPEGEIDARLPEQLAAAEDLLREAFAAGREG